jgi:hypothetical protein
MGAKNRLSAWLVGDALRGCIDAAVIFTVRLPPTKARYFTPYQLGRA